MNNTTVLMILGLFILLGGALVYTHPTTESQIDRWHMQMAGHYPQDYEDMPCSELK